MGGSTAPKDSVIFFASPFPLGNCHLEILQELAADLNHRVPAAMVQVVTGGHLGVCKLTTTQVFVTNSPLPQGWSGQMIAKKSQNFWEPEFVGKSLDAHVLREAGLCIASTLTKVAHEALAGVDAHAELQHRQPPGSPRLVQLHHAGGGPPPCYKDGGQLPAYPAPPPLMSNDR